MAGGSEVETVVALTVLVVLGMTTTIQEAQGQPQINNNEASVEGGGGGGAPRGSSTPPLEEDPLENTVFAEMLRIVDQKFDSLSARISVLERSVNSLNFYSVRQFREIAKSVEGSTEATDRLRSQMVKLDADDRALKAAVSQVGRDINGIKKSMGVIKVGVSSVRTDVDGLTVTAKDFRFNTEKMLDDIATSIVYLNENTKQKSEDVKGYLEARLDSKLERVSAQLREDRTILLRTMEQLGAARRSQGPPVSPNCSVNLRPLEERLDKKFAEIKRHTQSHFLELLNAEQEEEAAAGNGKGNYAEGSRAGRGNNDVDYSPPADQSGAGREDSREMGPGRRGGGRDGEKVMRMLANMTRNVMDAVTYFRHTGGMMEHLLATTENVAREQTRLRYDVLEAGGLLFPEVADNPAGDENASNNNASDPDPHGPEDDIDSRGASQPAGADHADLVVASSRSSDYYKPSSFYRGPEALRRFGAHAAAARRREQAQEHSGSSSSSSSSGHPYRPSPELAGEREGGSRGLRPPPAPAAAASGLSSEKSLAVLAELTRNGTQLLEVLTDLAQLSSSSLTKAVGSLHQEVVRLEDVRARLNQGLLFPGNKVSSSAPVPDSGQGSGPGLSPCGGSDVAGLTNTTKTIFTIVEAIASNTGWIPYIFHNMQQVERLTNKTLELAKRSLLSVHLHRGLGGGDGGDGGDAGGPTQAEALDVIYKTNVQLLRILPALTRLVAEPEPLVALVEGGSAVEGRVEVFYKGRWGSVCADLLGHREADALCRHLGHPGGIWAGIGHFSRGRSGRFWAVNATCLDLSCPFLITDNNGSSSPECQAGHLAVVCDHMLKLTPLPAQLHNDNNDDNNDDDDDDDKDSSNSTQVGAVSLHHQGRWLPICSLGWTDYEARVACRQMGFLDGRKADWEAGAGDGEWRQTLAANSSSSRSAMWVSGVSCSGEESRLDACSVDSYQTSECAEDAPPAAVRCQ